MSKSIFLRCVLFVFAIILSVSLNIEGQCKREIPNEPFEVVSVEFRQKLVNRFKEFMANKCNKDFTNLYTMLKPSFRTLNAEEEFVSDYQSYYRGNNKFISFTRLEVGESISPIDKRADIWFIHGCLIEQINRRKRSRKTYFMAAREIEFGKENIFFIDVTTKPNPLGEDQKCRQ